MKRAWFEKWGWIYRPVSWQGILVTFLCGVFCGNTLWAVDRHSHSVSDTLYGIFPFWVPAFLVWMWVAQKKS